MSVVKNVPEIEPWKRRLYLPAYNIGVAAHYAGTSPQTVGYWFYGGGDLGPALPGKEQRKPLTYLQLIELAFVATFRRLGVSLQRIRKAREYAATNLNSEYPFVELRWKTEGTHMLLDLIGIEEDIELKKLIVADQYGQLGWEKLVGDRFVQFDYINGLALIWHVAGRESPVIIDPRIAFGAPTIRGIATWVVKGRWEAKETVQDIKDDFGLTNEEIKYAFRFEGVPVAT
ncbi:MAG: DUF433 domain-containing protein [Dehalococcoidia bacterium]|nr:DUF433 domain-containing protein [Dehalococcoidia bacterium]MDD5493703.1 DUF433 domain-containing protein [Dehalococcoidia bacterium]